jgi:hypothetical protein
MEIQECAVTARLDRRFRARSIDLAAAEVGSRLLPQYLTTAQTLIKESKLVLLANEMYLRLRCVAARYPSEPR